MRYAIVIERAAGNYSAFVPDLPGCVATGQTVEEVTREVSEAVSLHVADMRSRGLPVPLPSTLADYVETVAPVP